MNTLEELENQSRWLQAQITLYERDLERVTTQLADLPSFISERALRTEQDRLQRTLALRQQTLEDVRLQIARHHGVRDPRPYHPVLDGPSDPRPTRPPERDEDERER